MKNRSSTRGENMSVDHMRHALIWTAAGISAGMCQPALAQDINENAIASSQDAFGRSVGNEQTGLYSAEEVRGLNPLDAGNARIEGLYFDQIDRFSQRLQDGSTIRVGISALHYPFPAPSGLVDYDLTKPGRDFEASLNFERADFGSLRLTGEAKIPLDGERLGLSLGGGLRKQQENWGATADQSTYAGAIMWRPAPTAEVMLFGGWIDTRGEEARPTIFPAGSFLPPRIKRRQFLGQDWAVKSSLIETSGTLFKAPLGKFRLEAGIFRSRRQGRQVFSDLLTGVSADGLAANRTIVADGNNFDRSTSGEARVIRDWHTGNIRNTLTLSLRGRDKLRRFGGTQRIALGISSAIASDPRPMPLIGLGEKNSDHVRQSTLGIAYSGEWLGRGSLDLGISTSDYRKTSNFADPARPETISRDRPILWNIGGALIATRRLAFYAALVNGQEEALVAPEIAINRSEAPPAIRTRQVEAGLRYAITPKMSFVGGVFAVRKPYFNLDPGMLFRQLGTLNNRGIELSLAGEIMPGLSAVAGTVFLDAQVAGEAVDLRIIGPRPVGSFNRRSAANIDFRTGGGNGALSFDLAYEGRGKRVANTMNALYAPARNTFDLGMKYRFDISRVKALLRVHVQNLFNEYGWAVTGSGGVIYSSPRTINTQLLLNF